MRNEELLGAWLRLSTVIDNERIVSDMPYNESLICNILRRNQLETPERELTATDLCQMTRMLKSQMNRTLGSMEEKGIVVRERSVKDKRRIFIRLDMKRAELYEKQHARILTLVDRLIDQLGSDRVDELISLLRQTAEIAEGVF